MSPAATQDQSQTRMTSPVPASSGDAGVSVITRINPVVLSLRDIPGKEPEMLKRYLEQSSEDEAVVMFSRTQLDDMMSPSKAAERLGTGSKNTVRSCSRALQGNSPEMMNRFLQQAAGDEAVLVFSRNAAE